MDIAARCFLERRTIVDRRERGEFARAERARLSEMKKGQALRPVPLLFDSTVVRALG